MKKIVYTIATIILLASCNNGYEYINRAKEIDSKVLKINVAITNQDIHWGEEALVDSLEVYYTELKELSAEVKNAGLSSEEAFKVKNEISAVSDNLFTTKHLVNEHFNQRIERQKNQVKNETLEFYQRVIGM